MGSEQKRSFTSMYDELATAHRTEIRKGISRRIKKCCAHLSDEDFLALVESMTERQLTGERRANRL
jgi:hypothetical protein